MTIVGKYERDSNFTTVYSNNTIYTISRNTGDWACKKVGDIMWNGQVLTQEAFDKWENACEETATFELN